MSGRDDGSWIFSTGCSVRIDWLDWVKSGVFKFYDYFDYTFHFSVSQVGDRHLGPSADPFTCGVHHHRHTSSGCTSPRHFLKEEPGVLAKGTRRREPPDSLLEYLLFLKKKIEDKKIEN